MSLPVFLAAIDEFIATDGGPSDVSDALFLTFHLLAEWRETSAYRPLAKLLRLPGDVVEEVLGNALNKTEHRVMAAVFDGDPTPLYEIVGDANADEFIRASMLETITMVTKEGRLPRAEVEAFLRACASDLQPRRGSYVWYGWVDAVSDLGFVELKPLVAQAFVDGRIDTEFLTIEEFERALQHAVEHPDGPLLRPGVDFRPFGDMLEELANWTWVSPDVPDVADGREPLDPFQPERNLLRGVGRNDPCPCGSGKKYKRCCLNADRDGGSVVKLS